MHQISEFHTCNGRDAIYGWVGSGNASVFIVETFNSHFFSPLSRYCNTCISQNQTNEAKYKTNCFQHNINIKYDSFPDTPYYYPTSLRSTLFEISLVGATE
jgi:hypothetical protein